MTPRGAGTDSRHLWRQARHAVARRHHPDVGGDPEVYLRLMREVDEQFGAARDAWQGAPQGRTPRPWRLAGRKAARARRRAKQGLRQARARLPRRFPGSRRYFDL